MSRSPSLSPPPRPRRLGRMLLAGVVLCCGCRHYPKHPQPEDPLPDYAMPITEPDLREQVDELIRQTMELQRRQDQTDTLLANRNEELRRTRDQHARALTEMADIRRELSEWNEKLRVLQEQLGERDEERLEELSELAHRVREISRAMQSPR